MPKDRLERVLDALDHDLEAGRERLFELLRIPSISTDPSHASDCRAAADWLAAELAGDGFAAEVHETSGHPGVVASDLAAGGLHVLFYGHYDVQPPDPLDNWRTPPFEPSLVTDPAGNRTIVARGASDDKGQLMTFLIACRAWREAGGGLPVGVTILLEGEEETGSLGLGSLIDAVADLPRVDLALACDTEMWDRQTPAIVAMLRGLIAEEIEITAAARDLHSGVYGSAARNPLQVIAEIIAGLRAPDGSVTIDGFYDDVREVPEDVAASWRGLDFDQEAFLAEVGLKVPAGERDRSVLEQTWSRPTCEVNGVWGGYTGEGTKTVIPATASAKFSFRLVADQRPDKIREAFRSHVRAALPADCSVRFTDQASALPVAVPTDGAHLSKARQALAAEWGREALVIGTGGTLPAVAEFKQRLGLDTLLVGFAQRDDNIHAPNEKYDLASFHRGARSWARILGALAAQ